MRKKRYSCVLAVYLTGEAAVWQSVAEKWYYQRET